MTFAQTRPRSGRLLSQTVRSVRRALARKRRWLAAGCVAAAVAAGLSVLAPPPVSSTVVMVAARDLPAGHLLADGDLTPARWPRSATPAGAQRAPAGLVLAAPVRRGEPVTDVRLTGPGFLAGQPPGSVAVTVRLADPASTLLVRPGDRADVLAGSAPADPAASSHAEVVATRALVLAIPSTGAAIDGSGGTPGATSSGSALGALSVPATQTGDASDVAGLIVVAVDENAAERLAAASGVRLLSLAVHAPSSA